MDTHEPMTLPEPIRRLLQTPRLTGARMAFAITVAVAADALQWLLAAFGPVGFFLDEAIDVVAMMLTIRTVGFHLLLLPTFVLEFIPLAGLLPTWTGCVMAVIALRKSEQRSGNPPAAPPSQPSPVKDQPYIDV